MKRASLIILLLVLGIVVAAYLLRGPSNTLEATYEIPVAQISLDPARVMRVDITRVNSFVRLEKVRGEWKITEPVYASVEPGRLRDLQEGVAKFRLSGMVSSNPEKQKLFEVDDSGISVLLVNDEGSTISYIVGKAAPTPGTAFVRAPLSDTVYIAQGLTPAILNYDLRAWRQRGVFETSPDSIGSFSLSSGGKRFDVRRSGQEWSSRGLSIPSNLIDPTVQSISHVQADAFIDTPMIIRSRVKYQVEMSGTHAIRMEFYPPLGADSNFVLKTSRSSTLALVGPSITRGFQRLVDFLTPPPVAEVEPPAPKPPVVVTKPPVQPPPAGGLGQNPVDRPRRTGRRVTEPAQRTVIDEGELTVHTVKRGEDINIIARKYEVSIEQLRKWNGLQSDNLVPGMEMYVFVRRK